jgi:hypothetical protein
MPTSDPPLPRHLTRSVHAALLHVIALAKYALVYTRSWAANSNCQRVRLAAKVDQYRTASRWRCSNSGEILTRKWPVFYHGSVPDYAYFDSLGQTAKQLV